MKKTLRTLTAAALLACATGAAAQSADPLEHPSYGFGISTGLVSSNSTSGRLDTQGLGISFALLRGRLRFEPELGFNVTRREMPGIGGGPQDTRSISVGGGVLYELARAEGSSVYAGGRLSLSFAGQDFGWVSDGWSRGEGLSAVLGGEYFPAPFMSIGLETQATLFASQADPRDQQVLGASTRGLLLFRFYVP